MSLFNRMRIRVKSKLCKDRYDKRQACFCYCPTCNNELIGSDSLVSDEELVTYKCVKCNTTTEWLFDAPTPILIKTIKPTN